MFYFTCDLSLNDMHRAADITTAEIREFTAAGSAENTTYDLQCGKISPVEQFAA